MPVSIFEYSVAQKTRTYWLKNDALARIQTMFLHVLNNCQWRNILYLKERNFRDNLIS